MAQRICDFLEARGIRCWIAPRDVRPGRQYGEEILEAIANTDAVVLVLTESANSSKFVEREIERAVSYGKPTLPVRVREVTPSRSLELFISSAHWIDAWKPPMEQYLDRLADAIRSLSPEPPEKKGMTEAMTQQKAASQMSNLPTRAIAIAGTIFLLTVAGAGTLWWMSNHRTHLEASATTSSATPTVIAKPGTSTMAAQPAPSPQTFGSSSATPGPDVFAEILNLTGQARSAAIARNLSRLPQQLTVEQLLTLVEGSFPRNASIKRLVNRLPNPISVEDALRILANTSVRERSELIELLATHLPTTLTVDQLLAIIEGSFPHNYAIKLLVNRLPNPVPVPDILRIFSNTAGRERAELLGMFAARFPGKLSVDELLAIIEGITTRNEAIRTLNNRLPNPLSNEDVARLLANTTARERYELITILSPRFPAKLTIADLVAITEETSMRNEVIKAMLTRLPPSFSAEEISQILDHANGRERFALIQIVASRAPRGLSDDQLSTLISGSANPDQAAALLKK